MKILITGATGALGQKLIPFLLNDNRIELITINRSIEKAQRLYGNQPQIQHFTLSDSKEISGFEPEIIIHLASYVTSSDTYEEGVKLIESNITYGLQLLDLLKNIKSIRLFLNFGTFAEYKNGLEKISNTYLYSASKTAFRSIVEYYSSILKFDLIHIVPFTIYGTDDEKKKIFDFILEGFYSENPINMSPGLQQLDFIHIDDVCNILHTIIKFPKIKQFHLRNIYLGTGTPHSLRDAANYMEEYLAREPKHNWGGLSYRNQEVMYACANINPLIELNCIPKIDLKTGIQNYLRDKKLI